MQRRLAVRGIRVAGVASLHSSGYTTAAQAQCVVGPTALASLPSMLITSATRHAGTSSSASNGGSSGGGGTQPPPTSVADREFLSRLPHGAVNLTEQNFNAEVGDGPKNLPIILYFHAPSHPDVLQYTKVVLRNVEKVNAEAAGMSADGSGTTHLAMKCGLIDCEREPALARHFRVEPDKFPMVSFVANMQVVEKLAGIHPESHVQQAFHAFLEYMTKATGGAPAKAGTPPEASARADVRTSGGAEGEKNDAEENPMTLQQAAVKKLQSQEYASAVELFKKARTMAEANVITLKEKLGVHKKKLTPEISEKLRKNESYVVLPQIICGLAVVNLAVGDISAAFACCQEVRAGFPWAVRDNRQVADTVCRVEMIRLSEFDMNKHSSVTLRHNDVPIEDFADFYLNQLRLAVAYYNERQPELAIEELLKLIRMEPKMMADLHKAKLTTPPEDGSNVTAHNKTPARRVLFLIFEALGNQHTAVSTARKKLAAFLYV